VVKTIGGKKEKEEAHPHILTSSPTPENKNKGRTERGRGGRGAAAKRILVYRTKKLFKNEKLAISMLSTAYKGSKTMGTESLRRGKAN